MNKFKIADRLIGSDYPPFIIAEMSGNHNQSLEQALKIVDAVAETNCHALKIQTYTPDTMTLDLDEREFYISDPNSLWNGSSLYKLYAKAYTPWEWHKPIFDRAKDHGLIVFSTPFDDSSVDFLEELDVPCYKISSFENTDLGLIRKVASTKKPLIISTGMASISELDETVKVARESGCEDLILLKCTSTYPADATNTNILTIPHMKNLFNCQVGLSDHTLGVGVAVASVALGATVIEKHFTLNRAEGGVDSSFSIEPLEMKKLVEETERAWKSIGRVFYGPTNAEVKSLQFRRSLYIIKDLKAGDILSKNNLRSIRPGFGLPPKYLDIFIGRIVCKDVPAGTALSWDLIK